VVFRALAPVGNDAPNLDQSLASEVSVDFDQGDIGETPAAANIADLIEPRDQNYHDVTPMGNRTGRGKTRSKNNNNNNNNAPPPVSAPPFDDFMDFVIELEEYNSDD
jgi:hypothetical protein